MRIFRDFCLERDSAADGPRLRAVSNDPDERKFWESCIESAPWEAFEVMKSSRPIDVEPHLSLCFDKQFEGFLTAAETGPFPVVKIETLFGLVAYVKYLSANPGRPSIALLRRTVALREHAPADEPEPVHEARQRLVTAAGRELKLDEFFR